MFVEALSGRNIRWIGMSYKKDREKYVVFRKFLGSDLSPAPKYYRRMEYAAVAHDLMILKDPRFGLTPQEAREWGLNFDIVSPTAV